MKIKLSISSDDIKHGVLNCNTDCPVARAVKSVLKYKYRRNVRAYNTHVRFTRMIKHFWYPSSVERFINRFDAGKPVKPFNFELDLPELYLKSA